MPGEELHMKQSRIDFAAIRRSKQRRRKNRARFFGDVGLIDTPANRKLASIPPSSGCQQRNLLNAGILHPTSNRYFLYIPHGHPFQIFGTGGWELRSRFMYRRSRGLKRLPPDFEIHHIDGNPLNDDPSNLQAKHRDRHLQFHRDKNERLSAHRRCLQIEPVFYKILQAYEGGDRRLPRLPTDLAATVSVRAEFLDVSPVHIIVTDLMAVMHKTLPQLKQLLDID